MFSKKAISKISYCAAFIALFSIFVFIPAEAQNNNSELFLNNVVIDAGHGGKDPGSISPDRKTQEKNLTLEISKRLAAKISKAYPSVKVSLTREQDKFVELGTRAQFASNRGADLFISIHINASPSSRKVSGFSVYILGQSSNKNKDTYAFNQEVLKRENSVIYLEDDSTKYQDYDSSPESKIFLQLMSNAYREQSLLFAQYLNDNMKGPFKRNIGIYQGNFAVLRLASMPAVLIELGFITSADDLAVLRSDESLDKIVNNLFKAFSEYKTSYDSSVSLGTELPKARVTIEDEPEEFEEAARADEKENIPETADENPDNVYYGTQVLASSKNMSESDPYFQSFNVKKVKVGTIYKYIIGYSEDKQEAKENFTKIKQKFKDSFMVSVSGNEIKRF